ncbi:MAG: HD domain-containing protein [Flavobacteriales bacterium]|nr:HD domain-containing protein [Flavobacteriales bacterium]
MDIQAAKAYILRRLKEELPKERTYHSLEHTLDVYASAIDIAAMEGVGGEDLVLLKIAALYHDSGFLLQDLEHEEAGCRIVQEHLPPMGFTDEQVVRIRSMIMATKVPQSPSNHVERILCDADLDYLGRNDFKRIAATLYEELMNYGAIKGELEWNELQVRFLENHKFHTATSIGSRETAKQAYLEELRRWLRQHAGSA